MKWKWKRKKRKPKVEWKPKEKEKLKQPERKQNKRNTKKERKKKHAWKRFLGTKEKENVADYGKEEIKWKPKRQYLNIAWKTNKETKRKRVKDNTK